MTTSRLDLWWGRLLLRRSNDEAVRLLLVCGAVAVAVTGVTVAFVLRDSTEAAGSELAGGFESFGSLAMFVAAFVIQNTFVMVVAERSRELAVLRSLGASQRQVRRLVLAEACGLGLVGSLPGLAVGGMLAALVAPALPGEVELVVVAGSLVGAVATGTMVTVVAAWVPSRAAATTPPVALMQATAASRSVMSGRRTVVGIVLGATAVSGYAVALTARPLVAAVAAASSLLVMLASFAVLAPGLVGPTVSSVGRMTSRWGGPVARLAYENTRRGPRRVGAVGAALALPVALLSSTAVSGGAIAGEGRGLVWASFGLAAFISMLGVFTSLYLATRERSREFAVLRVIGASPRQARAIVRAECALLVGFGTMAGLLIGVVNGVVVVASLDGGSGGAVDLPVVALTLVVLLAVTAGAAVSLVPARFVARLDILTTLRSA